MPPNLHEVVPLQRVDFQDRMLLRPLEEQDAVSLLQILAADPTIRERVTVAARMVDKKSVAKEIRVMQEDPGLIRYAIIDHTTCIGLMSLWRDEGFFGQPARPDAYGFGYFLDPAARGKGVTSKALNALMNVIQTELKVEVFMAFCEDNNIASKAVLEKLGFAASSQTFTEPTNGWIEREYLKLKT